MPAAGGPPRPGPRPRDPFRRRAAGRACRDPDRSGLVRPGSAGSPGHLCPAVQARDAPVRAAPAGAVQVRAAPAQAGRGWVARLPARPARVRLRPAPAVPVPVPVTPARLAVAPARPAEPGSRGSRPGQLGSGWGPRGSRPGQLGSGWAELTRVPAGPAGIGRPGIRPFPAAAASVAPAWVARRAGSRRGRGDRRGRADHAARHLCGPCHGAGAAVPSRPRGTRDRRPAGTDPACRARDRAGTGRPGPARDPARRNPATRPGARARNHSGTLRSQGFADAAGNPPQGRHHTGGADLYRAFVGRSSGLRC